MADSQQPPRNQTIAEFLRTETDESKDLLAAAETFEAFPEGELTAKQFADQIISSDSFNRYNTLGHATGKLPAAVVMRLMDYAWGQPVSKLEVKDTTEVQDLTTEQLQSRIATLQAAAAKLRQSVH